MIKNQFDGSVSLLGRRRETGAETHLVVGAHDGPKTLSPGIRRRDLEIIGIPRLPGRPLCDFMQQRQRQIIVNLTPDSMTHLIRLLKRAVLEGSADCTLNVPPSKKETVEPPEEPRASLAQVPTPAQVPVSAPVPASVPASSPPEKLLIDVKEVARLLDVSPRTVARLRDMGRMPHLGNVVRWHYDALVSWVNEGCPSQGRRRSR